MPFNIQLSKIRETSKVSDVRFPIPACAGAEKLTATTLPCDSQPATSSPSSLKRGVPNKRGVPSGCGGGPG
jgi:hypothetical protein